MIMFKEKINMMQKGKGFIAALDQSGGSTPKALKQYGVTEDMYQTEEEMFDQVHQMRSRILQSPVFTSERVLGVILFENTMNHQIDNLYTADYLWKQKKILSFLKIDQGLMTEKDGVQFMKDISDIDELLNIAKKRHIFGTKMRSVIHKANAKSIQAIVRQQFDLAEKIAKKGLVPIVEPEVNIHAEDKHQAEIYLHQFLKEELDNWSLDLPVMLKLTLPSENDFYYDLSIHPKVLRMVALSGGYPQTEANEKLSRNKNMIASFSRALLENLHIDQDEDSFNNTLNQSIENIYQASIRP